MSGLDNQNISGRDYDEGDEAGNESFSPSTGGSTFDQIDEVEHVSTDIEENEGPLRTSASIEDVGTSSRGKSPRDAVLDLDLISTSPHHTAFNLQTPSPHHSLPHTATAAVLCLTPSRRLPPHAQSPLLLAARLSCRTSSPPVAANEQIQPPVAGRPRRCSPSPPVALAAAKYVVSILITHVVQAISGNCTLLPIVVICFITSPLVFMCLPLFFCYYHHLLCDDSWLYGGEDELNAALQERQKEMEDYISKHKKKQNSKEEQADSENLNDYDLKNISESMQAFVKKMSSYQGAEVPESRIFLEENAIVKPPLWLELQAIFTPYLLHSPHRIWVICHPRPLLHHRPVRQDVVFQAELGVELNGREESHAFVHRRLKVMEISEVVALGGVFIRSQDGIGFRENGVGNLRVVRRQPEEAGEGGRHRVAAGEEKADHDVSQVDFVANTAHESREKVFVIGEAQFSLLTDHFRR
nr:protein ecdysoneless homolog [Ipomoea batatas]